MAYKDFREWIAKLEGEGELKRIKVEVDWNEEIGGITRRAFDMKEQSPALLFENIKDYQNGHCTKLFTGSVTTQPRIALMLDLPKNTPSKDIIETVRKRLQNPLKPVMVKDGPCKEHVEKGEDVNILEFPVPKWSARDGGRYINTFSGVITKDPETGWTNVGLYRGMVIDEKTIGWYLLAGKHWGRHYHAYRSLGKPMPVATVYGTDPLLAFCACAPHPPGVSEYDIMSALREQPVELVKCETIDLEVPANAEIVVEGLMPIEPESYQMEGPFGEFTGYYGGGAARRPVTNITCVTHRNGCIYRGSLEGRPPTEDATSSSVNLSVVAWNALDRVGIAGITDVYCPMTVGFGTNVRVQINKRYQGHAKQVAACLWAATTTNFKNVTVVDDDIDIHDSDALEWAITYRVDPKEDLVVFPGCPGSPLDPSTDPRWKDVMNLGGGLWNRLLTDATKTWKWGHREEWWGERFPPTAQPSPEIQKRVEERWNEYGF
ncbi:UbiD family decarboxylase [Chloroflexota bacterium]